MANLSGSGKMSISGRATISAEQIRTGRYIVVNDLHAQVQAWAMSETYKDHELYEQFIESLAEVGSCSSTLTCYRARRFSLVDNPSHLDMGPPPPKSASGQRYNRPGSPALYLCESMEAVSREPIGGDGSLWVQRFLLPGESLKIADLRVGKTTELITQILWFAEHAEAASIMPPLSFSQCVASLVAYRFDAMLVPGVRGEKQLRYNNVVVLRRIDEWVSWVDTDSAPRPINGDAP